MTKCITAVENRFRPTLFCHACCSSQYSVVRIHCDLGAPQHAVVQICQKCLAEANETIALLEEGEVPV